MFDFSGFGKILILVGLVIAGLGFLLLLGEKIPWLGKLPGDFFYKGKDFTFYFPLATCIIISIILTIIIMFINRK
ncbi:MAG: DUF2905 domain-containing protein [Syntrophales bacterium]